MAGQAFLPTDLTTRADSCQVLLSSNGIFQRFLLKLLPPTVMERALLSRSAILCILPVFASPPLLNPVPEETALNEGTQ